MREGLKLMILRRSDERNYTVYALFDSLFVYKKKEKKRIAGAILIYFSVDFSRGSVYTRASLFARRFFFFFPSSAFESRCDDARWTMRLCNAIANPRGVRSPPSARRSTSRSEP